MTGSSKNLYYDDRLNLRFEKAIIKRAEKIVKRAIDDQNFKKYDSISHFIRAAIIRQIREDEQHLNAKQKKRGRLETSFK